jgi:hypothetical protein
MKEAPVLVWVSVLIVVGIGIWLATGGSLPFATSQPPAVQPASDAQSGDAQTDASKQAEADKPVKKPVAKATKPTPVAEPAPEPAVIAPVAEVVIAPPIPPPAPKQFPSAREISVGAARENISERFGEPSLATTTTSGDGRVMETLVYARKSGRDVTVIRMEDGKVLSAYSR